MKQFSYQEHFFLINDDDLGNRMAGQLYLFRNRTSNSTHELSDFYVMTGNHESAGVERSGGLVSEWNEIMDPFGEHTALSGINDTLRPYRMVNKTLDKETQNFYVVEVGNIAIIMFGNNLTHRYPSGVNGSGSDWTDSDFARDAFVSAVNYFSPDHNIIVCSHETLDGSGLHKYASTWLKTSSWYTDWLTANKETHHIVAWFSGHDHYRHEPVRWSYVSAYNTTFIYQSSIDCNACIF